MHKMDAIREEELLENGGPYLPVCLCLDTSGSMLRQEGGTDRASGRALIRRGPTRMELLRRGIEAFYNAIYSEEITRCTVEVAIVTFSDKARKIKDFSRLELVRKRDGNVRESCGMIPYPVVEAGAPKTCMGEGVNMALDLLEQCKKDYIKRGVDYYQPWLVLISDGGNGGSPQSFERARTRVEELVSRNRLAVYPLAIGSHANVEELNRLSPAQPALPLESANMPGVFRWLAKSSERVSNGSFGYERSPKMELFEMVSWLEDYMK